MKYNRHHLSALLLVGGLCFASVIWGSGTAFAVTKISDPAPQPGSFGLEATKPQAPPKQGAQITTPGNGGSFSSSPIDVNGVCPKGVLVEVYDNGVMVGAVTCKNGSFHLKVSLFAGKNKLTAMVYDDIDQTGPKSNTVTVTYSNARFTAFGELVTLTSDYGRRSAGVGSGLDWPLKLTGGTGPYALSIDWGDSGASELKSQASPGSLTISHVYKQAGIYVVSIKATDKNGVSAFLQVMAVASGTPSATANTKQSGAIPSTSQAKVLWIPSLAALVLIPISYWLGRRSEVVSLRRRMAKERDAYKS